MSDWQDTRVQFLDSQPVQPVFALGRERLMNLAQRPDPQADLFPDLPLHGLSERFAGFHLAAHEAPDSGRAAEFGSTPDEKIAALAILQHRDDAVL
jgi:hypothetical protein